jgi:hypothetical protein
MLNLERTLEGHKRIAKEMTAQLPEKTAKQIRDKRKEPSYKLLLQQYNLDRQHPEQGHDSDTSDNEGELRIRSQNEEVRERELEGNGDMVDPRDRVMTVGEEEDAQQYEIDTELEDDNRDVRGNNRWQTTIMKKTLDETSEHLVRQSKYRETQELLVSKLKSIIENEDTPITQSVVDEVYVHVLALIDTESKGKKNKPNGRKDQEKQGGKRKMKRYIYSRTQDLFRKNPKLLAKHIREGI